jgi:hypothetical protein
MMDLSFELDVLRGGIRAEFGDRELYNHLKAAFEPNSQPAPVEIERERAANRATMDAGSARRGRA